MLFVLTIFLGTVVYRQRNTMVFTQFPVNTEIITVKSDPQLYLFLFFSGNSCSSCINELVSVLNDLTESFHVVGVIPDHELKNQQALKKKTGALFPLHSSKQYKQYSPTYTPSLICVSSSGNVLFLLPGISGQVKHLEGFLKSVQRKRYSLIDH
jgi:thioredoxin-related protein